LRHWNDLKGSLEHAKICEQINQEWGFESRLTYINLVFAFQAVGDSAAAMQAIRQAEEITAMASPFWAADVNSVKALLWLEQGNLDAAVGWVQESGLKVDGDIQFRVLRQYLTLAQVLLTQGQRGDWQALNQAMRLISRLRNLIEAPGAAAYVLQILIMQALGHQVKGERKQALSALNQALTLGEPGGYVWVFVRAGEPMQRLLQLAMEAGIAPSYCKMLLGAHEKRSRETNGGGKAQANIPDPLTNRELEVLRLLNTELSIPEIAAELVISIGTTRTHIKRIYRKLDAHSRFEAISKAKENRLV
jgi:LuxR family maltose regulon positive regulatory protein